MGKYDELFEKVKELPIDKVFRDYGFKLYQVGQSYNTYSPFRKDAALTSFTISPSIGIFKDWVIDGYTGDSIKFISLLYNLSYFEACFHIALTEGFIDEETYNSVINNKRKPKNIQIYEQKYNKPKKIENNIADATTLNDVFNIFISCCKLSEKHKEHLMVERNLTEDEIKEFQFFTFPSRAIIRTFIRKITDKYENQDVLETIPGFYKRVKDANFTFMKYTGIGIPIKNVYGEIVGIQIRKDTIKDNEQRYGWFSSSFAIEDMKGENEKGTSSGSPIDVVYPKELKSKGIFITEGKFKAIKIAEQYNSICLSVQGISTWRPIINIIENLEKQVKQQNPDWYIKRIYSAFDADICRNINVYNQLKNMTDTIEKQFDINVEYLYWDLNYGKGIDDLFNDEKHDKVQNIKKEIFDNYYKELIEKVLELNPEIESESKITSVLSSKQFEEYFDEYFKIKPIK